ncbi:MAG: tyrosine-type recombinase/integrase [Chloroflexi bacterium]|nr:tyrosine-type recombinase/integrase [Chloroflexota bacterium]
MTIDEAIESFLNGLRKSPRTVITYRGGLSKFRAYLSESLDIDPSSAPTTALTINQVLNFMSSLAPNDVRTAGEVSAMRSALTYLAAVRKFYAYLVASDLHPELSTEKLSLRLKDALYRFSPPPPRVRTADLERLLSYVKSLPPTQRPHQELRRLKVIALFLLLYRTGMRISELCALRRQDVDLDQGTAFVFRGKGGKSRLTYFDSETAAALAAYWQARLDSAQARVGELPAFSGRDKPGDPGRPISPRTVEAIVATCCRAAGVESTVTPHTFRHGLATELVRRRVRESVVQRVMGHASPATTQIYVHLVGNEIREEYQDAFGHYHPPRPDEPPSTPD